ncbi:hypothetical protein FHX74_003264 [Friedmanniella endophytica]|uniref:Transcriptional regulator WhiB n=1 Tax=Microlunatus kandeliicorticis TaxID=1759536 RepID=A0A7W3P742_9ACTN|nr:hypothetical protein [Microlunatus kandeliicorticis]
MKFAATLDETIDRIVPAGGATGTVLPCHRVDPELFFAESPADVEYAKALCLDCPIQQACLAGALERQEPWGVWGGQLFVQGVVVPRKRPRGRPRKHPLPEPVIDPRVAPAARTQPERSDRKERAA